MRIIKTETDREIVKKKSRIPLGNGTIIIANIAIIKPTIVKSFALTIGSKYGTIRESHTLVVIRHDDL